MQGCLSWIGVCALSNSKRTYVGLFLRRTGCRSEKRERKRVPIVFELVGYIPGAVDDFRRASCMLSGFGRQNLDCAVVICNNSVKTFKYCSLRYLFSILPPGKGASLSGKKPARECREPEETTPEELVTAGNFRSKEGSRLGAVFRVGALIFDPYWPLSCLVAR